MTRLADIWNTDPITSRNYMPCRPGLVFKPVIPVLRIINHQKLTTPMCTGCDSLYKNCLYVTLSEKQSLAGCNGRVNFLAKQNSWFRSTPLWGHIPHITPGSQSLTRGSSHQMAWQCVYTRVFRSVPADGNLPQGQAGKGKSKELVCFLTRVVLPLPAVPWGHLAQDAASNAGSGRTHQGLEVLTVVAGVGGGEGPQHRVPLVALQRRDEEAAAEVRGQHVAARRLPGCRPVGELHSRLVACGRGRQRGAAQGLGPGDRGPSAAGFPSPGGGARQRDDKMTVVRTR